MLQGITSIGSLLFKGTKDASSGQTGDAAKVSLSDIGSIAQRYDVKNISPKELAALSTELYDAGLISMQTHTLLSTPLPAPQTASPETSAADTRRNALAQWQQEFQRIQNDPAQQSSADYKRMALRTLENLDALRNSRQS